MKKNWLTTVFGLITLIPTVVGLVQGTLKTETAIGLLGAAGTGFAAKDSLNKRD